jgi:hypothetical protein
LRLGHLHELERHVGSDDKLDRRPAERYHQAVARQKRRRAEQRTAAKEWDYSILRHG